jgi:hypothetical protein
MQLSQMGRKVSNGDADQGRVGAQPTASLRVKDESLLRPQCLSIVVLSAPREENARLRSLLASALRPRHNAQPVTMSHCRRKILQRAFCSRQRFGLKHEHKVMQAEVACKRDVLQFLFIPSMANHTLAGYALSQPLTLALALALALALTLALLLMISGVGLVVRSR